MEENQTNQNLNQQPVQPVQPQSEQVQSVVQEQATQTPATETQTVQPQSVPSQPQQTEQASVSMQIQQLLVQQQQYQQQYNQLVEYVKNTPNLPIEQVNQIKQQLDQLNALFVQWKQKLQELWYTQVQVNKPTEVKSWSKNNFSFKKLAIGCGIVVFLILVWFFVTLMSLKSNPNALLWIWIAAWTAKMLLQLFGGLLLWSVIILMLWVVISNIYRLITVKNQSKLKYVWWLIWWLLGTGIVWVAMWFVFNLIGEIVVDVPQISYSPVQAFLVWQWQTDFSFPYDKNGESWKNYHLIAPSEFAFAVRWSQLNQLQLPSESTLLSISLVCWNKQNQILTLSGDVAAVANGWTLPFNGKCLYGEKWSYQYGLNIEYRNEINREVVSKSYTLDTLDFESEFIVTLNSNSKAPSRLLPTLSWKSEFNIWKAPSTIRIDATQIFRDFGLESYNLLRDKEWNEVWDIENLSSFDVYYNRPQVYHPTIKFPDLSDFIYTFPVRVEQSTNPICELKLERFPWTTKYKIVPEFIDGTSASTISLYRYTIINAVTNKNIAVFDDTNGELNYTFPEKWSYMVKLEFTTVDKNKSWCQSDVVQLEKDTFNVDYYIVWKDSKEPQFKELCSSSNKWCDLIHSDAIPYSYQLWINSITPLSNTTKNVVYLDDKPIMDDDNIYSFNIEKEWEYSLKIITSDVDRWMDEEVREIKIVVKRPNIVWNMAVTSRETRQPILDWFEPLTVILDASKTEVNVPWDEIVYFTWDFGDGEVKSNQQNWVVSHTYNYDYVKENGVFQPKVTVVTLQWLSEVVLWPKLNVKKWLINVDISSTSHPTRQAKVWQEVVFSVEFDGLPEKMTWDFGDGSSPTSCPTRACTEVSHVFYEEWMYTVKLTLDFDAIQQVDSTLTFKVY